MAGLRTSVVVRTDLSLHVPTRPTRWLRDIVGAWWTRLRPIKWLPNSAQVRTSVLEIDQGRSGFSRPCVIHELFMDDHLPHETLYACPVLDTQALPCPPFRVPLPVPPETSGPYLVGGKEEMSVGQTYRTPVGLGFDQYYVRFRYCGGRNVRVRRWRRVGTGARPGRRVRERGPEERPRVRRSEQTTLG